MDYISLNENQRKRMSQICTNDITMKWENPDFYDIMIGKLPPVRYFQEEKEICEELDELENYYLKYNFFNSDRKKFIETLQQLIDSIHLKKANWYGVDLYEVKDCICQQEFCLISGEGGIGKSYFVKCLEEEFENANIPHLCIYGKFEKDIQKVDISQIIEASENGFIFVVDAINEMTKSGQRELLKALSKLVEISKIRIILTYRNNSMDNEILEEYKKISKAQYAFPGVSFESALNELLKLAVPDIYKYENILFSNNALLISILCQTLTDHKITEEKINSVASITYILESYIKKSIKKTFRGKIDSTQPKELWEDIKRVAKWMYEHNVKSIDKDNLFLVIETKELFVRVFRQAGIIDGYEDNMQYYYFFVIDSLTDFLIARSLFEDISGKVFDEQAQIISDKINKISGLDEAVILAIFDNFAPDYKYILDLCLRTQLIKRMSYEMLVKVNFKKEDIPKFIEVFEPVQKDRLITIFGGYTDKPFNCTNYLNMYYQKKENQVKELTSTLSGTRFLDQVKGRLKNLLYYLTVYTGEDRREKEAFYFALWCCAAPNQDLRCLAMKLLYEIVEQNNDYKNILIRIYDQIEELYIKEAMIYVLAVGRKNDPEIVRFFNRIKKDEKYISAKSIKRISVFLNDDYGYIHWRRDDLFDPSKRGPISDDLYRVLEQVDLADKNFLPFRYWSRDSFNMYHPFLKIDKQFIINLNQKLEKKYSCVKNGECSGWPYFERKIKAEYGVGKRLKELDDTAFLNSFEFVIKEVFTLYGQTYKDFAYVGASEFQDSIFLKCFDISVGIYYGSLMCNYFINEFATYNNTQNNIGYEVYDPIKYDEDIYIATPISLYQDYVEKLGDRVLEQVFIPKEKDVIWVRDVDLTRENLLSILQPIEIDGIEWILLAGRISFHEEYKHETRWKDTYDIWCCTSQKETIYDDGNARYLTIELEKYKGNLLDYIKCDSKPWLCKDVYNINYHSEIFEHTNLVLPPAELIRYFQLVPEKSDMSWRNAAGEIVIYCNNNRNSYYVDPIGSTIFIKKNYFEEYIKEHIIKFFAFTERFIPETGYADETELHFEVQNGIIVKELLNSRRGQKRLEAVSSQCLNCPYGYSNG